MLKFTKARVMRRSRPKNKQISISLQPWTKNAENFAFYRIIRSQQHTEWWGWPSLPPHAGQCWCPAKRENFSYNSSLFWGHHCNDSKQHDFTTSVLLLLLLLLLFYYYDFDLCQRQDVEACESRLGKANRIVERQATFSSLSSNRFQPIL